MTRRRAIVANEKTASGGIFKEKQRNLPPNLLQSAMQQTQNFWEGKEPCWQMLDCTPRVRTQCAAFLHPDKPCWEQELTRCEMLLGVPKDCPICSVYARYHAPEAAAAPNQA